MKSCIAKQVTEEAWGATLWHMQSTEKDIAIIGAGIMGLSTAYWAQKNGFAVTIYDKNDIPVHNASWLAGGMLAPYSEIEHMPDAWLKASIESVKLWHTLIGDFHEDIDFYESGSLLIAHEDDHHMLTRFASHLTRFGDYTIDKAGLGALEPQLAQRFNGALHFPEEGHVHPRKAMDALYAYLKNHGCSFKTQSASPQDLESDYGWVIDCRGYGAAKDDSTLRGVKGELLVVRNAEFNLQRPVRLMHPRYPLYIVPRRNYEFMIGATMIESAPDNEGQDHVSVRSGLELLSALYSIHPSFGDAQILEICAGIRPAYPDNLPRIIVENNHVRCNGLFRHGFLLGPMIGQAVAALANGDDHPYLELFTQKI